MTKHHKEEAPEQQPQQQDGELQRVEKYRAALEADTAFQTDEEKDGKKIYEFKNADGSQIRGTLDDVEKHLSENGFQDGVKTEAQSLKEANERQSEEASAGSAADPAAQRDHNEDARDPNRD